MSDFIVQGIDIEEVLKKKEHFGGKVGIPLLVHDGEENWTILEIHDFIQKKKVLEAIDKLNMKEWCPLCGKSVPPRQHYCPYCKEMYPCGYDADLNDLKEELGL